jgi:hypothetical protein
LVENILSPTPTTDEKIVDLRPFGCATSSRHVKACSAPPFVADISDIQASYGGGRERDGAGATAADDESVPIPSLCVVVTCPSKDTKGPNKGSDREAVAIIAAHTAIVNKRG